MTFRRLPLFLLLLSCIAIPVFAQESEPEEVTLEAKITELLPATCGTDEHACFSVHLTGLSEAFQNRRIEAVFDPKGFVGAENWKLEAGDRVILQRQMVNGEEHFSISDVTRRLPLAALALLFIVCVVLLGGFAAVRSFLGMIISFAILFLFIMPAILAGRSPILVSVVGSIAIMAATLLLSHGRHPKTWAALAGTSASLIITMILAIIFTWWTKLFGFADEDTVYLLNAYPDLNAQGLLLAGIIIGALGALDDITISQASAVFELKRANPRLGMRDLYTRALTIGKDHISAAVNTLVLAYAGASLPLLLLLTSSPLDPWSTLINREVIATEIVRTLVGSIGLLAAVPLTTILACYLASRRGMRAIPEDHGHTHHH